MNSTRSRYRWLIFLNIIAVLATIYLTYVHFKPGASEVCNFSEKWDCEIVNQSIYSELWGIPVSILGFLNYAFLLSFSIRGLYKKQDKLLPWVLGATILATAFALYLTGIETFVLKTYCIFCVIQQIIILLDLGILTSLTLHRSKP
jgi:uncharacterized membrane protein